MKLETFEIIDNEMYGIILVEHGTRRVDVADPNTEEWEDVLDRQEDVYFN